MDILELYFAKILFSVQILFYDFKIQNAQFSIPISLAQPLVTMEQRLTGRLVPG